MTRWIVGMALAAFATAAPAQEAPAPEPKPKGSPVRMAQAARDLADYGRQTKEPLALIVAAGMRKGLGERAANRAPEGGAAEAPGTDPDAVETLLAEAVALANGAPAIRALAEDVRATATKGRSGQLGYSVGTVKPGGVDWYRKLKFDIGKYAETSVDLTAQGEVDLHIYDAKGNLVCRDLRQPKTSYCGWTPREDGVFDVKIENRTPAPVRYRLTTN